MARFSLFLQNLSKDRGFLNAFFILRTRRKNMYFHKTLSTGFKKGKKTDFLIFFNLFSLFGGVWSDSLVLGGFGVFTAYLRNSYGVFQWFFSDFPIGGFLHFPFFDTFWPKSRYLVQNDYSKWPAFHFFWKIWAKTGGFSMPFLHWKRALKTWF